MDDEKFCKACARTLPMSMFYVYGNRPSTLCRKCHCSSNNSKESTRLAKERYANTDASRATKAKWNKSEAGVEWWRQYRRGEPYRSIHRDAVARERARHPERTAARSAVSNAVLSGKLTKQPCHRCGSTDRIQGHHHMGYEKEHWLSVEWLCVTCHQREHGAKL